MHKRQQDGLKILSGGYVKRHIRNGEQRTKENKKGNKHK